MTYFKYVAAREKPSAAAAKAALLCGVSLIAWGIVVGRPDAANAQQTISASTSTKITTNGSDLYINANVDATGSPGVTVVTSVQTISNLGTIVSTGIGIREDLTTYNIGTLVNGAAGTISGASGIDNYGLITALTNAGIFTGTSNSGIVNNFTGTIGFVSNTHMISGSSAGLYNYNRINAITNTGAISATRVAGILNTSSSVNAVIGTLTNSGVISSSGSVVHTGFGIENGGAMASFGTSTITSLNNALGGTINGNRTGVFNSATIGALTNDGVISAIGAYGVNNSGFISTISNQLLGSISGSSQALYNVGTITSLTNTGIMSGNFAAINNKFGGSIGAIDNTAVISGTGGGLYNYAQIGTVTNGGTISGLNATGIYNAVSTDPGTGTIAEIVNQASGTVSGMTAGIQNINGGLIRVLTNAAIFPHQPVLSSTTSGQSERLQTAASA